MESKKLKKRGKQIYRQEGESRTRYQTREFQRYKQGVLIDSKLVRVFPSRMGAGHWRPWGPSSVLRLT
jgi:hypothetical protein